MQRNFGQLEITGTIEQPNPTEVYPGPRMLAAYRAFIDYIVAAGQYCGGGQFEFIKPCDLGEKFQGRAIRLMPSSAQQSIQSCIRLSWREG